MSGILVGLSYAAIFGIGFLCGRGITMKKINDALSRPLPDSHPFRPWADHGETCYDCKQQKTSAVHVRAR